MSRRAPNPAAERAAQNQQTIKSLLKLDANKTCADCKRNKHPRWASWNLGVFICIRCSGIHRGMGTHISRVKSVDLDSWTDEQLQSILSWGNARANKYWEDKLAVGHVPSEAKIENFIRTKYELKRWVMDGPMPDPATLDADGDDDMPLSLVKEKQTIDRKESIRKSSVGQSSTPAAAAANARTATASPGSRQVSNPPPIIDLMGGAFESTTSSPPLRGPPGAARIPPKSEPAPPKTTPAINSTKDSLLGLDFLGSAPAAPVRPSSTAGSGSSVGTAGGGGGGQSRPDLKQSILSLYAAAPRAQLAPQQAPQTQQPLGSPGALTDAFGSLSFSSPAPSSGAASPKPADAFAGLSGLSGLSAGRQSTTSSFAATSGASSHGNTNASAFSGLASGSFFDTKPAAPPPPPPKPTAASSSAFGGFDLFASTAPPVGAPVSAAAPAPVGSSSSGGGFGDLFDFAPTSNNTTTATSSAALSSPPPPHSPQHSHQPAGLDSVFNLSSPAPKPSAPAPAPAAQTSPLAGVSANWSNADVWGNDPWGGSSSDTTTAPAAAAAGAGGGGMARPTVGSSATVLTSGGATNDFGWGSAGGLEPSTSGGLGSGGSFASQSIVPGAGGGFNSAPKVAADEEFGGWASGTTTSSAVPAGNGNTKPAAGGFGAANEDLFSNVWG